MYKVFHQSLASQDLPFRKGIEHFSLNITHDIHRFHQYIFAIGSSILEIAHPKSQDQLLPNFPGWPTRVRQVRRMNFLEALLSDTRKVRSQKEPDLANKKDEVLGVGNYDPKPE
jgi:hypothetical protein